MFQRTFLTGFAFVLLAAQACGGGDGKKHVESEDAGMGGEPGPAPGDSAGGNSAGAPSPGMAGEAPSTGGAGAGATSNGGGEGGVVGTAGMGGEPVPMLPPDPELLFSVKPGAVGLANSAVNAAGKPENFIYSSKTGRQEPVGGTNAVKITGAALGLDPGDQIVAFAVPQAKPSNPRYLFSIADGSEGANTTRTYVSYWQDSQTEEGDVYYSDGEQSFRDTGDGGEQFGYNGMLATELSLGLTQGDGTPDDLTGVAAHDANLPITELYFAVSSAALGAADSAVASADPTQRSCTVFKSALDGTNSVAFTCANLGLFASATGSDQIDALAVYGAATATNVVFSVASTAQGAVDSEVEATRLNDDYVGCTLFQSAGDGSNAVLKGCRDLGLGEYVSDEVDGLAIIDAPNGKATKAGSCELAYDPLDKVSGGGLDLVSGTLHIGNNVLVLMGPFGTQGERLIAYDANTCAFRQQVDLPDVFSNPRETAIVPLAGWSKTKPLDNVEYLRLTDDDQGTQKALRRYDASGTFVQVFPIANTANYDSADALVYEPVNDQLYVLLYESGPHTLRVVARPNAAVTSLDAPVHYRTHPCGYQAAITGTDAAGNLYIAAPPSDISQTDYRVCTFTPRGELLPAPYWWTADVGDASEGFIVPGAAHFLFHSYPDAPSSIERGAYQAP